MNMDDIKVFSANKAREMLKDEIENDNICLIPIMDRIQRAIKRKENCCYINSNEKEYVLNKLRELGYTVSDIIKGDRYFDNDTRKISW